LYNCGAELKEGADVCLNCGGMLNRGSKQPSISDIKANKPKTPLFNLISGIALIATIVFYLTSIFQSWIDNNDLFWIGADQYAALVCWLVLLGVSIAGFIFSQKEFNAGHISIGQKYLAIFMFVTALLFLYVIYQQYGWQFN